MAEAYLPAKFHLAPSNRLATVHQHHRQTDRQTGRTDNGLIAQGELFYKSSPKKWKRHSHKIRNAPISGRIDYFMAGFAYLVSNSGLLFFHVAGTSFPIFDFTRKRNISSRNREL